MSEEPSSATIAQMHRWFAVECNNDAWVLIEKVERSAQDDREMMYLAYASAYHWYHAGTLLNDARAELTLSFAHSVVRQGDLALQYGLSCLEYFENNDCEDWDLAFGHAAVAFAAAVCADVELHAQHYAAAQQRGTRIADQMDREIFMTSFDLVPPEV